MAIENESGTFEVGETTVHRLGFGAMRLTGEDIIGRPDDEENARSVVRRAVELGVDLIDTADSYGPGVSERILREALAEVDADPVVASKAGLLRHRDGEWLPHGDPDYLHNQVLASKDRLGVDSIDLYQFHRPDPDTDFEDSVHAFAEMKDAGQVDHVGLSNVTVEQLDLARDIVDIATVQNQYNITNRDSEAVLEACENHDIGFIPWFPLAAGSVGAVEGIDDIADRHDATPHQIALAWLLHHSEVTLPIPGTADIAHLEQNVAAADIDLTDDEMATLT
jgi:aryl-alcohol dehydrogenase-like predicted oxidoreductase